jgi:catechol-2,3-dioxygenase
MSSERVIKGLGEVALQVQELDEMTRFYEDVVGLELMRRFPRSSFFRIAEGVEGHTQILALFDRERGSGETGTKPAFRRPPLDHIAFGISPRDFEAERSRLKELGCSVSQAVHDWVGWRSLYIHDPEGNHVEWVCFEEELLNPDA